MSDQHITNPNETRPRVTRTSRKAMLEDGELP